MRSSCVAAAVLAVCACGSTVKPPRARLTPKQMVERSKPAIVRIEVFGAGGRGIGTGFAIAKDGLIVTNFHVIQGVARARVVLHDGSEYDVDRVVAIDEAHDLVVIGIAKGDMMVLEIGDSEAVSAGDPVFAIGNPLGADYTISDGLISAVRQFDELTMLQISAPISQGSSGGPLLNHYGEVIGVATWVSEAGQNLNFGMPAKYLQPLLLQSGGESFEAFAMRSARLAEANADAPKIERRVPRYPVAFLDGCTDDHLQVVTDEIAAAIAKGAPIYNSGDHETCFRIYEGVALRLETQLSSACKGPREALGQGLLRAETLESYTEKAWAMRDAFDGLLGVMMQRMRGD